MGSVFARGLLRLGHPVYPITRAMDPAAVADTIPEPQLVLIAVAEADLVPALSKIPGPWRDCIGLLQNELLPSDWIELDNPTVISVWLEKKPRQDYKIIMPSPVYGPNAQPLADALGTLDIPTAVLDDPDALLFELVLKNLYILTTNLCGLRTGGDVATLWAQHRDLARRVGNEVIDLQEALTGRTFDRNALFAGLVRAFEGDRLHKCMGRSAPARLARALSLAADKGMELPTIAGLAEDAHPAD